MLAAGCAWLRAAPRLPSGQGFDLRCARRRGRGHGRGGETAVSRSDRETGSASARSRTDRRLRA
ncbi:MAG: hypothetical protein AVDCRST_MAG08-4065 [uncultured Acetobacteraceae bacterium]|uniref:Uncharacterized protein n=1 Tax=uncultured Acetobacteraceae bacterium TaxID=169975 RepID=A0A6J4JQA2_9PROT|nr:MAG: hypothetical protein AVDCRST_MAG08-4065 [uncultured Acetobacteraceae bacterium]